MCSQFLLKEHYLEAFLEHLGQAEKNIFLQRNRCLTTSVTRVFYHDVQQQTATRLSEVENLARTSDLRGVVLVVENIDLNWLTNLGVAFKIDPTFFAEHTYNPPGLAPYKAVFGKWSALHMKPVQTTTPPQDSSCQLPKGSGTRTSWHVHDVLEHNRNWSAPGERLTTRDPNFKHRMSAYDQEHGWSTNTRISYSLVKEGLCKGQGPFLHIYMHCTD